MNTTSPLLPFSWKNSVTTPFGRISKHLENWLLKNILKKKEIKHKKKSRCKDFSEDFKKKKKNETHLIPSSSHSLTSFLKIRIYEFECCYLLSYITVDKNELKKSVSRKKFVVSRFVKLSDELINYTLYMTRLLISDSSDHLIRRFLKNYLCESRKLSLLINVH